MGKFNKEGIPKKYLDMIGTQVEMSGHIFSMKQKYPRTKVRIYNVRWGSATIINMETMEDLHPSIELLIKAPDKKRKIWSRPLPVREIDLKNENKSEKTI